MVLAMLMTLALMVYSLGQRQLRLALQKGKPIAPPTLRWILQSFLSVRMKSHSNFLQSPNFLL